MIADHWDEHGIQAHRGSAVAGFPNLFFLVGPNTGLGHNSMVLMIEAQAGYLVSALDAMQAGGYAVVEPRADVQARYNAWLQEQLAKTVWMTGGCSSWYIDKDGRNSTLWPTFTWRFMQEMRKVDLSEYVAQPPLRTAPAVPAA